MRRILAMVAVAVLAMAARADEGRPCRLDLASEPEGATAVIDGVAYGRTPLTAWDLRPGAHHVRFSLPDHEPEDLFVTLGQGEYVQRSALLARERGLLLVTSEPAGCDLSVDGLSLGETPRLVTTLGTHGVHRLLLQKAGYLPQKLEVRFDGRVPVVRHAKMVRDCGAIRLTSDPAGAEVKLNGTVVGTTPITLDNVAKGRSVMTLSLAGYAVETREIALKAGDDESLHVELKGLPGGMAVQCNRRGALVAVDGKYCGKAPLEIRPLDAGEHELKVSFAGCTTVKRLVEVFRGETAQVTVELASECGAVAVKSSPAGAQVLVDGRAVGVTRKGVSDSEGTLLVEELKPGEHEVTLKLHGYGDSVRKVTVEKDATLDLAVRMREKFTPDVELESVSGAYRGVMKSNKADGVTIETSPGVIRTFRPGDIIKINFLDTMR